MVTVSSSESYSMTEFRKLSGSEAYSCRTLKELANLFFAMGVLRESLYEYFRPVPLGRRLGDGVAAVIAGADADSTTWWHHCQREGVCRVLVVFWEWLWGIQ